MYTKELFLNLCKNGNLKFIPSGIDINMSDDGWTPLITAIVYKHAEVVKLLIKSGADVNLMGSDDKSPLYWASHNGLLDVVQELITAGADLDIGNNFSGNTPLYAAVDSYNHYTDIIKALVSAGADANKQNKRGWTPLHIIASLDYFTPQLEDIYLNHIKILISGGADVNLKDKKGKSPLSIALNIGNNRIIKALQLNVVTKEIKEKENVQQSSNNIDLKPIVWTFDENKVASYLEKNWGDLKENRNFGDFENLRKAADWKNPNFEQGIKLCKQQLNSTPDFDSTYIVIAEHFNLKGKYEDAIASICAGLDNSLRKSYLLSKLGDIYYKLENPVAAMIAYSKSVIASIDTDNLDYVAFLNLAYLFQFSGYENASFVAKEKSNKLSRKDYHSELDFDYTKVNNLQQMVLANENQMQSWALKCIEELDENGWKHV